MANDTDLPKSAKWSAKRSGAPITVSGTDPADGHSIVLSNVTSVEGRDGYAVASTKDGRAYALIAEPA